MLKPANNKSIGIIRGDLVWSCPRKDVYWTSFKSIAFDSNGFLGLFNLNFSHFTRSINTL